jgi:hypothetical protein
MRACVQMPRLGTVAICVTTTVGLVLAGCGQARLANGQPCIPSNALGTTVFNADATDRKVQAVSISPGDVVTMQLVEPEGYASSPSPPPPQAFPWLTPQSSDVHVLKPIAVCPFPPYTTTLNETLAAFTAEGPGQATINARVNPAYPNPPPMPGFAPPEPFQVSVVVVVAPYWVPWAIRFGYAVFAMLLVAGIVAIWGPRNLRPKSRS